MKVITGIFKVLGWAVNVILVVTLLGASPILLGFRPVVVLSPSMEPTYPVGSLIYYRGISSFNEIKVGDAITFKIGDSSLATHRVVEVIEDTKEFVTKGDANPTSDPSPISFERVVGKTSKIAIPYLGFWAQTVKNGYVIAAIAFVVLGNFLLPGRKKEKSNEEVSLRAADKTI